MNKLPRAVSGVIELIQLLDAIRTQRAPRGGDTDNLIAAL